jgi:GH35 family endo-1,4-beta-xylanase
MPPAFDNHWKARPGVARADCLAAACLALVIAAGAQSTITVDFPVLQDTWVNSSRPTRNYGSADTLQIKDGDRKIPYLQFEAHGITGTVTSAVIRIRSLDAVGTVSAHEVASQTWDETSMTYDTRSAIGATAVGSHTFASSVWGDIPVTSAVSANGLFSFALRSTDINGEFWSKESGSNVPVLRVTFTDANQAPTAQPESYKVFFSTLRTVGAPGVLANDTDPNKDPLAAELVLGAAHGALDLAADGSFTYLPDAGFSGTDSFTYRAVDSHGGSSLASDPVTVSLVVLAAGTSQFTDEELARFEADLGVTLTVDQQLELAAIVKPSATEAWRVDAEARIDQHRKADLGITVVDNHGAPVAGAEVVVKLKRKTFRFGGVADLTEFTLGWSGGVTAAQYRAFIPPLFDAVGVNNALKPRQSAYQNPPVNIDRLNNEFFPWCAANNLRSRGHLLMWPGLNHLSAPVEAKVVEIENTELPTQAQLDELRALVDAEVNDWSSRWDVYEWDVVNEPLGNHRIQDLLGPQEMARWFSQAQANRPGAGRLVNEFQIISGKDSARIAPYRAQIQLLLDNNAPLTGIGFQSRFKFRREDPATLFSRLEQFAGYNLDLVGTEFEVLSDDITFFPDENLRARMTEEIMTVYFSHPKVTGFNAWDFLTDLDPALVSHTGVVKLNGLVWYYLNRLRYDTRATLTTDSQGRVNLRAFRGEYEITVNTGSAPVVRNHTLNADSAIEIGTDIATTTSHTRDVSEDTFAQEANPDNTGNFLTIQLRNPDGFIGRVGYLKFDLAGITGNVTAARLRLHDIAEPQGIRVMAVASNAWAESTLTWNNRPATGAVIGSAPAPATLPAVIEIPLDPAAIRTGGPLSLAITETGNSYGTVASSENTSGYQIPQLILTTRSPDTDGDGILDVLDRDDDNDGLPDDFEGLHGLDPLVAADALTDADDDGLAALLEFGLALDPGVPDLLTKAFRIDAADGGAIRLTIRRRSGMAGMAVALGCSPDAVAWQTTDPDNLSAAGFVILASITTPGSDSYGPLTTREITFIPPEPRQFFRLVVGPD